MVALRRRSLLSALLRLAPLNALLRLAPLSALLCASFYGCGSPEPTLFAANTVDVYYQDPLRMVDILLVVDSSGSMREEQTKLADNFEGFIEAFLIAEVDYHIGVVTTDIEDLEVAGILQGDVPVITPSTPDAAAVFAQNVDVGTTGSGYEMGLDAAHLALSEPRISDDNAGFYRQDASLSIVVFSDENDLSPGAVDEYLNYFASLKGAESYRDHSLMNVSAVVGDAPYGCEAEDGSGQADAGTRYIDAASRTSGVFASICSAEWSPIVQALGLDISGVKDEFPFTRCPKLDTLEVLVDGQLLALGVAYDFIPERRSIRFMTNWIPAPGARIEMRYEYHPEDSQICPAE